MSAEPVKYEPYKNARGHNAWRVTEEWKEWRKHVLSNGFRKSPKPKTVKGRPSKPDPETHQFRWREVASFYHSDKKIFFCACTALNNAGIEGCGAAAIQYTKSTEKKIIIEPRYS